MVPIRFFFLSVRDPKTDFRRDLVAALRQLGQQVTYVRLARNCFVEGPEIGIEETCSPIRVAWWLLRACLSNRRVVVFSTVNLGFPVFCTLLRIVSWRAAWCFDLHDDLLYDLSGFPRLIARAKLAWHQTLANFSVRASPMLRELHPRSLPLCNASLIERVSRTKLDCTKVLVLSNIDRRFDFDLVEKIAQSSPDTTFHLHGEVVREPLIKEAFGRLLVYSNVMYHGAYANSDIGSILKCYDISLAPYRNDRSTRYIDPLRYYHCLNGGLEIITIPIPRALDMRDRVHIISSAQEFPPLLNGLQSGAVNRRNGDGEKAITWTQRAGELLNILSSE